MLRRALRAKARQLGGGSQADGMPQLVEEIAYQQWHRMLFARFLAENNLLMHPQGVAVTIQDCAELAHEEGAADAWELAARYAALMLPGIFLAGDPTSQARLAPESRHALEELVQDLPAEVFTADDALGWCYQFWQSRKKDEVSKSERKIGGADLYPVTQLFTEDYMVRSLLENSLGAWWAARHPDSPLVKTFAYLRTLDDGSPAAGTFPGWLARAAEVTVMDPCGGSGHFVVAALDMLRRMRMEEEGLGEAAAADATIRDNLFMLEIDPRCTQIAAFALAFAAWKASGYRPLPIPNIACSGIAVEGQLDDWLKLAGDDSRLRTPLERLYNLFRQAPTLGSLIDPAHVPEGERMWSAEYDEVAPLLERALARECGRGDPIAAWEHGRGSLVGDGQAYIRGSRAWGKRGVVIRPMRHLPCALYTGEFFDNNVAVIVPKRPEYLKAIWVLCNSPQFAESVRRIDKALKVTNATLAMVPFDLASWQAVADQSDTLTEPTSNDPTQWPFTGHPTHATGSVQAAVARLLGYSWPQEKADNIDARVEADGIVCLPPVAGEQPAGERLRDLLAAAYGDYWSLATQQKLLSDVGFANRELADWLRDGFFEQHCRLFHNRPFIWHIWDGRRDGFSALANYHKLNAANLDRLIYTYLGNWIETQRAEASRNVAGADGRLVAAPELKKKLELIRDGEPPYDICVRWKPLAEQPIGWNPDLNDGVRLNIRPFVTAGVLRSRFTINWNKDRGKNPDGSERLNDLHFTRAEKMAARSAGR